MHGKDRLLAGTVGVRRPRGEMGRPLLDSRPEELLLAAAWDLEDVVGFVLMSTTSTMTVTINQSLAALFPGR